MLSGKILAFTIIKPGFQQYNQDIIRIFMENGWEISRIRTTRLTYEQAKSLYAVHKKEKFYPSLCQYMSSGPCTIVLYERSSRDMDQTSALEQVGRIKEDIRNRWAVDDCRNVLHSSDSITSMRQEMSVCL